MPKYRYVCDNCQIEFFKYHSMTKILEDCDQCDAKGTLKKIPTAFRLTTDQPSTNKTGQIVKNSIEEFRQDLKEEKERLIKDGWTVDE